MIKGINQSALGVAYSSSASKMQNTSKNAAAAAKKEGSEGADKIAALKKAIESGEYKIEIDSLAKKMAKELLS